MLVIMSSYVLYRRVFIDITLVKILTMKIL